MGAVGSIAIAVGVVVALVVGISYVVMRTRSGEPLQVSLRLPLRVYLFAGVIAGLVVLTIGAAGLVRAGLGYGLGKEFSYYPAYIPLPPPLRPADPSLPPPQATVPPAPPALAKPGPPTLEEQRAARAKGLDRAAQEGLLNGLSYAVVGVVIWGVHVLARRLIETAEEREGSLSRGYLVLVAAVFFIVVLVNLPQAIFVLVRFYVLEPLGEFDRPRPPGQNLAFAVAALPAWVTYLLGAVRAVRRGGGAQAR